MFSKTQWARLGLAALFVVAMPLAAQAASQTNVSSGLTLSGAPLAIHGYDAVAFFTDGKAVIGQARYTVVHGGAAYQFTNHEHRKAFERNPDRYLPRYGGFCAYGAALGAKFDGDPRVFALMDGKLYFNLNPDIQKKWDEDRAGNISKADQAWPKIRDKEPAELGK